MTRSQALSSPLKTLSCGFAAVSLVAAVFAPAARADEEPVPSADSAAEEPAGASVRPWSEGVSDSDRERAQAHYDSGNVSFGRSSYADALAEYRRAIVLWDHPAIHFNMTVCLLNLQQPLEAYQHLMASMKYGPTAIGEEHYRQAKTYESLLESQLVRLTVVSAEPGVEVTLDGEPLFRGPGRKTTVVLAKRHQVIGKKAQMMTFTRNVTPEPGSEAEVRVIMVPVAEGIELKRRWSAWKPYALLGTGVALVAAGAGLQMSSSRNYDRYDREIEARCGTVACSPDSLPSSVNRLEDRGRRQNIASVTAFAIGGTIVAAGVTAALLNRKRPVALETPRGSPVRRGQVQVRVQPLLAPGQLGLLGGVNIPF